jgi:hypothetical protein
LAIVSVPSNPVTDPVKDATNIGVNDDVTGVAK